eukprot:352834-Chlamydomonas_euryale.AAC.15
MRHGIGQLPLSLRDTGNEASVDSFRVIKNCRTLFPCSQQQSAASTGQIDSNRHLHVYNRSLIWKRIQAAYACLAQHELLLKLAQAREKAEAKMEPPTARPHCMPPQPVAPDPNHLAIRRQNRSIINTIIAGERPDANTGSA